MPVVLGGGIAGLSAAYYLTKRLIDSVTVLEASKRLGGWIKSESHPKGFVFEAGPRTLRPKGIEAATTLQLIEELGLEKQVRPIFPSHPAAKVRMIYTKNQLTVLPSSISGLLKKIPPFSKPLIYALINDFQAPKSSLKLEDESIYNFTERRFGTEIADYAISPMICGICAGDAKQISVRFLMDNLFENEQKYGGVVKGLFLSKLFGRKRKIENFEKEALNCNLYRKAKQENWSMYSLKGGMEMLPKALAYNLKNAGVDINLGSECKKITFHNNGATLLVNGLEIETDCVFSALPTYRLAKLVEEQHPSLAFYLNSIPYVTVAVINLEYDYCDLLKDEAFGVLVPPSENLSILGIIFDSCCFDTNRKTVLTVMMGGKWFEEYFGADPTPETLLTVAVEHVEDILGIKRAPDITKVNILRDCIPQYTVGHQVRVNSIRKYIAKNKLQLALCGSAYNGVGINNVTQSAKAAVYNFIDNTMK